MKKWKQLLVTGLLAVSMALTSVPAFAEDVVSGSTPASTEVTDPQLTQETSGSDESGSTETPSSEAMTDSVETEESAETTTPEVQHNPSVSYSTHVQNIGWQGAVSDGQQAGTTGQSLRLEAIQVNLDADGADLGIQYRTHIQNIGWESGWHNSGEVSGTTGQALRLEAIQMKLTGSDADQYDLYVRVHAQNIGWMAWAEATGDSVATAGTMGASYRLEAIEIKIVQAGAAAPSADGQVTGLSYMPADDINYSTHVQNIGWQGAVGSGQTSGTSGRSLRLEAITINTGSPSVLGFQYRTHIQNIGWESGWHSTGEVSGTTGQSLRLEAIQIKLTGEMANFFDIYYRVHIQDEGWMGWAKNGESAGSEGMSLRLEAIQIVLRGKGTGAPSGGSGAAFISLTNPLSDMDAKAQGYSSSSRYLILINKSSHYLAVYTGSQGNWKQDRSWKIDCGHPSTPSPTGTFRVGTKLYYFDSGTCRCFYATQITGSYFMHSVLYYQTPTPTRIMDGRLGMSISHGCIRMTLENCHWIYNNIPAGTTVVLY